MTFKFNPLVQYYKTRTGRKVGPVTVGKLGKYLELADLGPMWFGPKHIAGQYEGRGSTLYESGDDLVDVWIDEKVEPVKEIVEVQSESILQYDTVVRTGTFGMVEIESDYDGDYSVSLNLTYPDSDQLRYAAKVFNELADFLEKRENSD